MCEGAPEPVEFPDYKNIPFPQGPQTGVQAWAIIVRAGGPVLS